MGGGGALVCTVLVIQADSRKEGRALALSCTPEEKQSVAARDSGVSLLQSCLYG